MTTEQNNKVPAHKVFNPQLQTLGGAIRAFRLCDELTQKQLAQKLNVSTQFISDVETGKKLVGIEFIAKLGKALGYGIEPFLSVYIQDMLKRAGLNYLVTLSENKHYNKAS